MKKVYIAAPLFNEMERDNNQVIANLLEDCGFVVYLPQLDAGEAFVGTPREEIFRGDCGGVRSCDILVALLDGRVPDEGMCFEMGMAFALGKEIVTLSTDQRSFMDGHLNVMLEQSASKHFATRKALYDYMETRV